MLRTCLTAFALLLGPPFSSAPALAQTQEQAQGIAIVDMQQVLASTGLPAYLQEQRAIRQRDLDAEAAAFQRQVEEYRADVERLRPGQTTGREALLAASQQQLMDRSLAMESELAALRDAEIQKANQAARAVIEEIKQEYGFHTVIDSTAVISSAATDITQLVIERMR